MVMEEDRKGLVNLSGNSNEIESAYKVGYGSGIDYSNHAITQPPSKTDIVSRINTILTSGSGTHR
jgi:hypothetical protein